MQGHHMSSDKALKITITAFLFFLIIYVFLGNIIGPGNKDFSAPLIGNYFYTDAGHSEKMIFFQMVNPDHTLL